MPCWSVRDRRGTPSSNACARRQHDDPAHVLSVACRVQRVQERQTDQGSIRSIPASSKSLVFRVARVIRCRRQIAPI